MRHASCCRYRHHHLNKVAHFDSRSVDGASLLPLRIDFYCISILRHFIASQVGDGHSDGTRLTAPQIGRQPCDTRRKVIFVLVVDHDIVDVDQFDGIGERGFERHIAGRLSGYGIERHHGADILPGQALIAHIELGHRFEIDPIGRHFYF